MTKYKFRGIVIASKLVLVISLTLKANTSSKVPTIQEFRTLILISSCPLSESGAQHSCPSFNGLHGACDRPRPRRPSEHNLLSEFDSNHSQSHLQPLRYADKEWYNSRSRIECVQRFLDFSLFFEFFRALLPRGQEFPKRLYRDLTLRVLRYVAMAAA